MVWIGVVLAIILAVNIKPASYAAAYKALSAIGGKLPSFSWLPGLAERGAFFALGFLVCMQFGGVIPPGPDPDPDPEPEPIVDDAPFPADGLTVLIVEEASQRSGLPASQIPIFTAGDIWMDQSGFANQILDQDTESVEASPWREALAVPRESVPWVVISNGRTGTSEPLPGDLNAFKELVGRFD